MSVKLVMRCIWISKRFFGRSRKAAKRKGRQGVPSALLESANSGLVSSVHLYRGLLAQPTPSTCDWICSALRAFRSSLADDAAAARCEETSHWQSWFVHGLTSVAREIRPCLLQKTLLISLQGMCAQTVDSVFSDIELVVSKGL